MTLVLKNLSDSRNDIFFVDRALITIIIFSRYVNNEFMAAILLAHSQTINLEQINLSINLYAIKILDSSKKVDL
jgi:hypothetical protein